MATSDPNSYGEGDANESAGSYPQQDNSSNFETSSSYFGEPVQYNKTGNGAEHDTSAGGGGDNQPMQLDAATEALIEELKTELTKTDPDSKNAIRLINNEIERLSTFGEPDFLEVDIQKPIKIVRKILVPVQRNPKFNFVGKLLGPGGRTLQNLIQETRCRIYILGRGSTREKNKEEELLASGDPKHAHLKDPLYIRVESSGPPTVAFQKISHCLNELQYYLQPVKDDIYAQQMADMGKSVGPPSSGPPRGGMRGGLMGSGPPGHRGRGSPQQRGGSNMGRGRGYLMQTPPAQHQQGGGGGNAGGPPQNYVTYPGYDYGNYGGNYQQPAPPAAPYGGYGGGQQAPPQQAGHQGGGAMPPAGPPVGPGPGPAPQAANYGANNAYNYPYGYDYSQYNTQNVGGGGPPRPPVPMQGGGQQAPGGGKVPPLVGRGRAMPSRPGPY